MEAAPAFFLGTSRALPTDPEVHLCKPDSSRPDVDAFVLDLLETRLFTSRDFVEMPNGVCRMRAPLTHDLALTLPHWRMLITSIVTHLAHAFRAALLDRGAVIATPRTQTTGGRLAHALALAAPSLLRATPRKGPEVRPYASKAWNAPRPEALALVPAACASCGKPVLKRRRRYCEACVPGARRTRAERAIATARKALATQALVERADPRGSDTANAQRGEANDEHHRRNGEWAGDQGASHDRARRRAHDHAHRGVARMGIAYGRCAYRHRVSAAACMAARAWASKHVLASSLCARRNRPAGGRPPRRSPRPIGAPPPEHAIRFPAGPPARPKAWKARDACRCTMHRAMQRKPF